MGRVLCRGGFGLTISLGFANEHKNNKLEMVLQSPGSSFQIAYIYIKKKSFCESCDSGQMVYMTEKNYFWSLV